MISLFKNLLILVVYINIFACEKTTVSKDTEDDNEDNKLKKTINIHKKNKTNIEATHMDLITFDGVTTCKNSQCPNICINKYNEKENLLLHKGLNTLVICKNALCKFYEKVAYCPKGYGKFDMGKTLSTQVCAYCKKDIEEEMDKVILYSCKYKIEGRRKRKQKEKKRIIYYNGVTDKNVKNTIAFTFDDSYRWISIIAEKI